MNLNVPTMTFLLALGLLAGTASPVSAAAWASSPEPAQPTSQDDCVMGLRCPTECLSETPQNAKACCRAYLSGCQMGALPQASAPSSSAAGGATCAIRPDSPGWLARTLGECACSVSGIHCPTAPSDSASSTGPAQPADDCVLGLYCPNLECVAEQLHDMKACCRQVLGAGCSLSQASASGSSTPAESKDMPCIFIVCVCGDQGMPNSPQECVRETCDDLSIHCPIQASSSAAQAADGMPCFVSDFCICGQNLQFYLRDCARDVCDLTSLTCPAASLAGKPSLALAL